LISTLYIATPKNVTNRGCPRRENPSTAFLGIETETSKEHRNSVTLKIESKSNHRAVDQNVPITISREIIADGSQSPFSSPGRFARYLRSPPDGMSYVIV